ncbi:MAG: hypothetical protein ACPL3C_09215 [Pyrobaculum sp.]|uniref:hypothetical protein n=1 Tax=Pyrobaculum sp. TaxID=2004705 RepID=UPI003CA58596
MTESLTSSVRLFITALLGAEGKVSSCEVLRTLSGKKLTGMGLAALYLFLTAATGGALVFRTPPPDDYAVVQEESDCVFVVSTPRGAVRVRASQEDGSDPVLPWRVAVVV